MPDPHVTASGERFARDLRRIREAHGFSIEDIHRKTMISGHIIESFEQDGLFEHPTFNRVYLRSFVRSYATAVDIDADQAIDELGRALEGNYANELAVEYLDDGQEEASSGEETPDATEPADAEPAAASAPEPAASTSTDPSEADVDDAGEEDREEEPSEGGQQGIWIGIGIVLAILVAWVLIGEGRNSETDASQGLAADTAQADTAQAGALADSLEEEAEPAIALGDTMYFTVIAQDNLRPIRIQRDADIRRPYWIERGRVEVFPAQRQIIMEEELSNIRLLLNGYEYPLDRGITGGRLVITRDSARTFLDTLATDASPHIPIVPADTVHIGS